MTREEELTSAGWKNQGTFSEPRLSEVAALYAEIGHEVLLENVDTEHLQGCTECLKASPGLYKTVYTRKL